MANKSLLKVDIDTSQFDEFLNKWGKLKDEVDAAPAAWAKSQENISKTKTSFDNAKESIEKGNAFTEALLKTQETVKDAVGELSLTWYSITRHGREFIGFIDRATLHLLKWSTLTGFFSGLIGAGGIFGMDRLAASATMQRTSAMGLGVTPGQQAAFDTYFSRLGDTNTMLTALSQSMGSARKGAIYGLVGRSADEEIATGNVAGVWEKILPELKKLADKTDPQAMAQVVGPRHLQEELGIGVESMKVLKRMPQEEVDSLIKRFHQESEAMNVPDDVLKKWADLDTMLEIAGVNIQKVLVDILVPLGKPLEDLSSAFLNLIETFLKSQTFDTMIKRLGKGMDWLSDEISSGKFQENVAYYTSEGTKAVSGFEQLAEKLEAFAPYLLALAGGYQGAMLGATFGPFGALAGGVLGATVGQAVQSRLFGGGQEKDEAPVEGAAPAAPIAPKVPETGGAAAPPLQTGPAASQRAPLAASPGAPAATAPAQAPSAPARAASAPASVPETAAPAQNEAAIPHPRRYQGQLSIDGETFDYASGSEVGGRGSSPYGEHPITSFDPTALHGQGGGAFRTQDVYDPQVRDVRGAVEIHQSRATQVDDVNTAGCFGIPAPEWPGLKAKLKDFMVQHPEGATLRVHPGGNAEIVARTEPRTAPDAIAKHVEPHAEAPHALGYAEPRHGVSMPSVSPQLQGQGKSTNVRDMTDGGVNVTTQSEQRGPLPNAAGPPVQSGGWHDMKGKASDIPGFENYKKTVSQIETRGGTMSDRPGSQFKGEFQMGTAARKQYGSFEEETARQDEALTKALGRSPEMFERYLAHNQGTKGAMKLLTHPDVPAGKLRPPSAIKGQAWKGNPKAPARQFIEKEREAFSKAERKAAPDFKNMGPVRNAELAI